MPFTVFVIDYTRWHYLIAPVAVFHIWMNFLVYVTHVFSLRLHLHTLFAPWHRVQEERSTHWNVEDWASTILVNSISRLVGFFFRLIIILMGWSCIIVLLLSLITTYIVWYLAPLIVTLSTLGGITIIFMYYANAF